MFFGRIGGALLHSGPESLEVALFSENDIPWDELAFPVITKTLKHYFSDRTAPAFLHYENLSFRRRTG